MRNLTFVLPWFRQRSDNRRRVPSGILSLAAEAVAVGGLNVEVIDAESAEWNADKVAEYLVSKRADVLGISVCSPSVSVCQDLVRATRSKIPEIIIIVGGKHVTHCWQDIASASFGADVLVRGEGETAVIALAQAMASGANRTDILSTLGALPNVWVLEKKDDPVLPPRFDLQYARSWPLEVLTHNLDYYRGDRMLVEFSRGCPGRCNYCLASRDLKGTSFRPVSQVVDTLAALSARGFNSFFFTDDDFAASSRNLRSLLEGIIERGLQITFDANVRPDSIVRCADLAPHLRLAGCRCLWLGIESGSPEILKSYNKLFMLDICERAVSVALSAAVVVRTNWIIGAPLETETTVRDSINFAGRLRNLGLHIPHISYLVPYQGTPVHDDVLALGLVTQKQLDEMTETTHDGPVMPTLSLSKDQLRMLFREFYLGYYNDEFFSMAPPELVTEARMVLQSAGFPKVEI